VYLIFGSCGSSLAQSDLDSTKILILHSFQSNGPVFWGTDKGLSTTLQSHGISNRNQFFEFLDLERNPGPEHRKLLVEQMRMRYSHHKPDMIITMFPEALEFVLKDCRDILPDVPILALYLPQRIDSPKMDRRIIGHIPTADITGTLEIALKLVPGARRVYIVSGVHEIDRRIEDQARHSSKEWEGRLEFIYLSHMPVEAILATISHIPPGSIVLALTVIQDVAGKSYTAPELVQQLSQVSTVPIFGILDVTLGHGIVGGSLINYELIGAKAGQLTLDILAGTKTPDDIPTVLDVSPVPMFDWRQLRHWNMSEDDLPEGSIVVNREFTLWSIRHYIIGILAFCLVETALIVFLIVQMRRKNIAEQSLSKAEEKYRGIFEAALEGIFESLPGGKLLTANASLSRMLGYDSPEELISSTRDLGKDVWVNEHERSEYVQRLEKQGVILNYESQFRRRDGTEICVSMSARRVTGPDGQTFYSGFVEDITGRKLIESETRKLREDLAHVTRVSTLGEFTSSLAHELNQPLAAILSSAQAALRFLQSDTQDPNLFRTILQNIVQDDKRAAGVITSLRAMVRRKMTERKPLDLNSVVQEVLTLVRGEAVIRNMEIETDFDALLPLTSGDRVQLQQVVLNLVMNAADAVSGRPRLQRRIILRTRTTDNGVQASVRDFGPGIDPGKLEDIWQPFFTTKNTGLGIGLSISSSIIRAHGGRIWAENNADGGATFTFEIPAADNQRPVNAEL